MSRLTDSKSDYNYRKNLGEAIHNPYVRMRVEGQLEWYATNCNKCKRNYYFTSNCSIILPILILILNTEWWLPINDDIQHLIIIALTGITTCLNGIAASYNWHDNMIRYRVCAEQIKSEVSRYVGRIDHYEQENRKDAYLLEKLELIIQSENEAWKNSERSLDKKVLRDNLH